MLNVTLFGVGYAAYDGTPIPGFPHQQPALLLAYLLLHRKYPHSREILASTFWGGYEDIVARKYLRNALWKLRQAFQQAGGDPDEYLLADSGSIAFIHTAPCQLDIAAFEEHVSASRGIPPARLTVSQAARLEASIRLYTAPLLEGIYADWCLRERERLRLHYIVTLQKLTTYHALRGDYPRAIGYAQDILGDDPANESAHTDLMWLYWLSGNRGAALAQYRHCVETLRTELGLPPASTTTSLYQRMRTGQASRTEWVELHTLAPQPPAPQPETDILRRLQRLKRTLAQTSLEIQRLEALLDRSASGG